MEVVNENLGLDELDFLEELGGYGEGIFYWAGSNRTHGAYKTYRDYRNYRIYRIIGVGGVWVCGGIYNIKV